MNIRKIQKKDATTIFIALGIFAILSMYGEPFLDGFIDGFAS